MKKTFLSLLTVCSAVTAYSQTAESQQKFNLDFEVIREGKPVDWYIGQAANYKFTLDSLNVKSGKYSSCIESLDGAVKNMPLIFTIPDNYKGKLITLAGYIKTENVTDGYAGLGMRIDPYIAADNMENRGVTGTTDWKKYSVTLKMDPEKTEKITFGSFLRGKGKVWFDDLKITIDGKDINALEPFTLPAQKDKEFDKGSNISFIDLDKNKTENLKTLGLVWGFLKYHHPNIAKGNYNWDYELFRVLPKMLNVQSKSERDEVLLKWIEGLGEFSSGKEIKVKSSEVKIVPDLKWIASSDFSAELVSSLLKVKNAKRSDEHYYIGTFGEGIPKFKENPYASMVYPDAGYRLLALYRYWNIIQYHFPYKNLIEGDWKNVLSEFIPKVANAKNETEYGLSMLELIGNIHDSHAGIMGYNEGLFKYQGENIQPLQIKFIEYKAVVTGFSDEKIGKESGMKIGDVITKVDNCPVEEIVKSRLKYSSGSNYDAKLRFVASNLLRTNDSSINIEFIRNNKIEKADLKTVSIKNIKYTTSKDSCFKYVGKDIAYVNNSALKRAHLPKIWKEVESTKGLIIDIRNYPSDHALADFGEYLMPKKSQFIKFTNGSIKTPGLFTFVESFELGTNNKDCYKGKIVLLTNDLTISEAEMNAMGYRVHPNATVIGSTTAGADGNTSPFHLPGNIYTAISSIGVYYPDGKETQRVGIVPDIEVRPTIQGIKDGRDELMEKAIEIINKG